MRRKRKESTGRKVVSGVLEPWRPVRGLRRRGGIRIAKQEGSRTRRESETYYYSITQRVSMIVGSATLLKLFLCSERWEGRGEIGRRAGGGDRGGGEICMGGWEDRNRV